MMRRLGGGWMGGGGAGGVGVVAGWVGAALAKWCTERLHRLNPSQPSGSASAWNPDVCVCGGGSSLTWLSGLATSSTMLVHSSLESAATASRLFWTSWPLI